MESEEAGIFEVERKKLFELLEKRAPANEARQLLPSPP